jgi:hypothetical protein
MPEPNLFQIFISRLNKLRIHYMVTGAANQMLDLNLNLNLVSL